MYCNYHVLPFHLHKWYLGYVCPHISKYRRHLLYTFYFSRISSISSKVPNGICGISKEVRYTLFIFYKNLVYKNIKPWNRSKIKNIVVILLVAISISFEGFRKKWRSDKNKKCIDIVAIIFKTLRPMQYHMWLPACDFTVCRFNQ